MTTETWHITPDQEGRLVADQEGRLVATVFGKTHDAAINRARLVAAAPELLKALEDADLVLRAVLQVYGLPEEGSIRHRTRAALRKARGGDDE